MKTSYTKPSIEIIMFDNRDIITTSVESEQTKPGHGWGDKNHNHSGPPGQNKK